MASHGVTRVGGEKPVTDQERRKELQRINEYKELVDVLHRKTQDRQYDLETLGLTSKLLKTNPEYYTLWNHRRRILRHLFGRSGDDGGAATRPDTFVIDLIADELSFLLPLLRKYPKCYWIWNYRLWLLEESTRLLPQTKARDLWQQELVLVGKMLSIDSRNFHGWGYRRKVIASLESEELSSNDSTHTLTEQEFEYTTRMINTNLSNFSAWHNRSKLIPRLLEERLADGKARRKFLDEELELIQRALWAGSDDQSLWFYHQYLMSTFDSQNANSLVPDLSETEKIRYLRQELERIQEMLEGDEACRWIYLTLTSLSTTFKNLTQEWPVEVDQVEAWVAKLFELDPLRANRYSDLKKKI